MQDARLGLLRERFRIDARAATECLDACGALGGEQFGPRRARRLWARGRWPLLALIEGQQTGVCGQHRLAKAVQRPDTAARCRVRTQQMAYAEVGAEILAVRR